MYCSSRQYILVLTTDLLAASSPEERQLNGGVGTIFPSFICVVNVFGMLSLHVQPWHAGQRLCPPFCRKPRL